MTLHHWRLQGGETTERTAWRPHTSKQESETGTRLDFIRLSRDGWVKRMTSVFEKVDPGAWVCVLFIGSKLVVRSCLGGRRKRSTVMTGGRGQPANG